MKGKHNKEARIKMSERFTSPERRAWADQIREDMKANPHLKQKHFVEKYGTSQMELSRIKLYRDSYNPFKVGILRAQIGDDQGNEYEVVEDYIEEMKDVWLKIKDFDPADITIYGDTFSTYLTYFDFYKTGDMVNMIINLYYTINVNGTESISVIDPEGNKLDIWD